MGHPRGFLEKKRKSSCYRPVCERVTDFKDVVKPRDEVTSMEQASRCMDCGVPFCHHGCPIGNTIPEWNDLMFRDHWRMAYEILDSTNNLPEITGRVCPATCEYACVVGLNDDPVTIRENELGIIERAYSEGWVKPSKAGRKTGKNVAVVGSGPAGLAASQQLARYGHEVTLFERDDEIGGILRYGIPDFKLEKKIIDRKLRVMEKEGVEFKTGARVGGDVSGRGLLRDYDAVCLCIGSRHPRDLPVPGRDLEGIYFAMDYLSCQNRIVAGKKVEEMISAKGKRVAVIGGGDTGSDCVGTAHRQGAECVVQIELMPQPPEERPENQPWPDYPAIFRTSSSHEEGGERKWCVLTKSFEGVGRVEALNCVEVEFGPQKDDAGRPVMREVDGSEFRIEADLVILAMGFVHPVKEDVVDELQLDLDARGNIKVDAGLMSSRKGVFAAGDAMRGASLVVWAIYEGRRAAESMHKFLMK